MPGVSMICMGMSGNFAWIDQKVEAISMFKQILTVKKWKIHFQRREQEQSTGEAVTPIALEAFVGQLAVGIVFQLTPATIMVFGCVCLRFDSKLEPHHIVMS